MAEVESDRSEVATPFKLKKAHERGQTARSADCVAAAVFAVGMVYLAWHGMGAAMELLRLVRAAFASVAGSSLDAASFWALLTGLLIQAASLLAPFLLLLMTAAAAASWLQSGFVLSLEPLRVDFQRLNPATGLRRLFSLRTLFDGARGCLKVALLGVVAVYALQALRPQFLAVASRPALAFLQLLVDDVASLGLKMALALGLVAGLDLAFTRREFGQRMRMSRRELKDEFREREGDPRIRGRLRELRRELLKRSAALRNTRTADVVLTNPTHYAVALRYVHGEMAAPQLVAKGAGELAASMREIAFRHGVVIVQNPPLARRLFRELAIEALVPPALHAELARIFVWVFALRAQRRGTGEAA